MRAEHVTTSCLVSRVNIKAHTYTRKFETKSYQIINCIWKLISGWLKNIITLRGHIYDNTRRPNPSFFFRVPVNLIRFCQVSTPQLFEWSYCRLQGRQERVKPKVKLLHLAVAQGCRLITYSFKSPNIPTKPCCTKMLETSSVVLTVYVFIMGYDLQQQLSIFTPRLLFSLLGDCWPPQEVHLFPGASHQLAAALVSLLCYRLTWIQAS